MKKQKGFTLPELMIVIAFAVVAVVGGGTLYAVVHFVSKFW